MTLSIKTSPSKNKCTLKAQKRGTAVVSATYKGKTYKCKVTVGKAKMSYRVWVNKDSKSSARLMGMKITNNSTKDITFLKDANYYVSGSDLLDRKAYLTKSGKAVKTLTIKPGKTAWVNYYFVGKSTYYGKDSSLQFKVKFDGKTYTKTAVVRAANKYGYL